MNKCIPGRTYISIYPSKLSWLRIWCPSKTFRHEMNLKDFLYHLALLDWRVKEISLLESFWKSLLPLYSRFSNICGVWNSRGLGKISKTNSRMRGGGSWNSWQDWTKVKIVIVRGVSFEIAFFFSFLIMKMTVLRTFAYTVKVR